MNKTQIFMHYEPLPLDLICVSYVYVFVLTDMFLAHVVFSLDYYSDVSHTVAVVVVDDAVDNGNFAADNYSIGVEESSHNFV